MPLTSEDLLIVAGIFIFLSLLTILARPAQKTKLHYSYLVLGAGNLILGICLFWSPVITSGFKPSQFGFSLGLGFLELILAVALAAIFWKKDSEKCKRSEDPPQTRSNI